MGKSHKYYVVWQGNSPGIYDTWQDCLLQVKGFPDAKYKAFPTLEAAKEAYVSIWSTTKNKVADKNKVDWKDIVKKGSIAVDAACSGNPGDLEYRGVDLFSGDEIFHQGPFSMGTNNIGEFLAIIHALALFQKQNNSTSTIYSDSKTAISWIKRKKANTKLEFTHKNQQLKDILQRGEFWLKSNTFKNQIMKWETEKWGEIPADFGRK